MASRPAPNRQFETTFPTPLIGDVLFTERWVGQSKNVPAYGTTHPNTLRWPNHKLVFVRERDEPDSQETYDFFYAADRASQDLYNFNAGWESVGGVLVRSVKRSYVTPRAGYINTSPAVGSAMPRDPGNKFPVGYVLHRSQQATLEGPLNSLYVVDERIFILHEGAVGSTTGTWGIEDTTEELVTEGDTAPSGFGIKQSEVSPIGNGTAIEKVVNYPAPASANIIYELQGQEHDELTGAIIDTYKVLCNAGFAKSLATTRRGLGDYVEIKSLDKWHSILVAAKVNGTIASQTWKESRNINLPDVLTEVGIIWDANSDSNGGTSGVDNIATIEEKGYTWNVSAEAAISGSVMGRPYHLMRNGFKGSAEVEVVRTFHYGPPNDAILAEAFNPVYGTLTLHGASTSTTAQARAQGVGDTKISSGGRVRYSHNDQLVIQQIGPVVHSGITLTNKGDPQNLNESVTANGGSVPGGGLYPAAVAGINIAGKASLEMPASSIPKNSGSTYILHVDVRPWRLGWWIREVYTAKVP